MKLCLRMGQRQIERWKPAKLSSLKLGKVFIADSHENFPWYLLALIGWVMDEMTEFTTGTALDAVVHATWHSFIILWSAHVGLQRVEER